MTGERWFGAGARLSAVLALHVMAIAAIAQMHPEVKRALAPIMVSLITPPEPLPQAQPSPSRKRPTAMRQPHPALPVPAPAPTPASSVESLPQAIGTPAPPPEPASRPSAALPVAAATARAAPAPLPPRFDAAYLNNPAPVYPALARRLGERGRVLLRVYVNADGKAREVQVRTSSGSARLDRAAQDAVERWKFMPARQGEEPADAWVLVPISFQLEG